MKTKNIISLISIAVLMLIGLFLAMNNDSSEEETNAVTENLTVKEFLLEDQTDENEYIIEQYVCTDFVNDVMINASKAGFDTFSIIIHCDIWGNVAHELIVFVTPEGLIYADVTGGDAFVSIDFSSGIFIVKDARSGEPIYGGIIDWWAIDGVTFNISNQN